MGLDVEMECLVENLTVAGESYTKGDTFSVSPPSAAKLLVRNAAKKIGVAESEQAEEPVEEEEVEEAESEGEDENESSDEDDD